MFLVDLKRDAQERNGRDRSIMLASGIEMDSIKQ